MSKVDITKTLEVRLESFLIDELPRQFFSIGQVNGVWIHELVQWCLSKGSLVPACEEKLDISALLLFLQPSTRTRISFELAMKSARFATVVETRVESLRIGDFYQESLGDALLFLAEIFDVIVVRSGEKRHGLPELPAPEYGFVVNAGDAAHDHPTQALGDILTMARYSSKPLFGQKVLFFGENNLRTVKSFQGALGLVGAKFETLVPSKRKGEDVLVRKVRWIEELNISLREMGGADFIYLSGVDHPEFSAAYTPPQAGLLSERAPFSGSDFLKLHGKPLIMHPGPTSFDVDWTGILSPQSRIREQVQSAHQIRKKLALLLRRRVIKEGRHNSYR